MSEKSYRVVQWATGTVGKTALKHFIENPAIELAGVWVSNPEKVGKDAGELVGLPATGVITTSDVEQIIATDADCVFFAGLRQDLDLYCRFLRSGKNVVSAAGPFNPTKRYRDEFEKIEAACREGGTSYHGCGVHPGFSGDILPLTLTRLMNRIDRIEVTEVIDKLRNRWSTSRSWASVAIPTSCSPTPAARPKPPMPSKARWPWSSKDWARRSRS
ncbi:hypothetical protein LJR225_001619 [Phenylobacterium sp. LjRoot225]|uniref:hypothetical protein n=1 Tax=Phenylobacterium sp. LjRoot225 TaxID=3342285 RepID=UPI003ED133C9